MVEMPGVEPGSNVYEEGLYDHGPLVSPRRQREPERGGRVDAKFRTVVASGDSPTSLMTLSRSSEDQPVSVAR